MNVDLFNMAQELDRELSTLRLQVENLKKLPTTANSVEAAPGAGRILEAISTSMQNLQTLAGHCAAKAQAPDPAPVAGPVAAPVLPAENPQD